MTQEEMTMIEGAAVLLAVGKSLAQPIGDKNRIYFSRLCLVMADKLVSGVVTDSDRALLP